VTPGTGEGGSTIERQGVSRHGKSLELAQLADSVASVRPPRLPGRVGPLPELSFDHDPSRFAHALSELSPRQSRRATIGTQ
jgi:hypothetical protein